MAWAAQSQGRVATRAGRGLREQARCLESSTQAPRDMGKAGDKAPVSSAPQHIASSSSSKKGRS